MSEYIERGALIKTLRGSSFAKYPRSFAMGLIAAADEAVKQPIADVVEVKHGRWDSVQNPIWPAYSHDKCNLCGWWNTKNALCYDRKHKRGHSLNYCPNCGAKMDGE